ncbi:hypothetical protein BD626DRAFT_480876 [Schizophyllum amplum]|uniref:Uncharacterized protein n=1 Tax=Schizophyllum amplum TaxID=97359 RepID=A0A550CTL6_9AGAR|nr:hypothetical protein BD626DRAFT_480876 [Auriculariopsis ampla]
MISSSSTTRHPLRELPIHLFGLPDVPQPKLIKTNIFGPGTPSPKPRPNKRPHSPGEAGLFSPAKRRILEVEGMLSPQKVAKTPSSAYHSPSSSRFVHALTGPGSPAKKLDFLSAPEEEESITLVSSCSVRGVTPETSPARLAPSPDLQSMTCASSPDDCEMSDYFSSPARPPAPPIASAAEPIFIPRVAPPPTDPTSVHYPGFQVYVDEFYVTYETGEGAEPMSAPSQPWAKEKENRPAVCRPKGKKSVTDPIPELKALLFSPEGKKSVLAVPGRASSLPISPAKTMMTSRRGSPTPKANPRSSGSALAREVHASSPLNGKGRKELRRMLEDEVDAVEDEDSEGEFL